MLKNYAIALATFGLIAAACQSGANALSGAENSAAADDDHGGDHGGDHGFASDDDHGGGDHGFASDDDHGGGDHGVASDDDHGGEHG